MAKKSISISLDPELIDAIDRAAERAGQARQVWIGEACEERLGIRQGRSLGVGAIVRGGPKTSAQAKAGVQPIPKGGKK